MTSIERDGWSEYSKLVLKEIETLGFGISNLNEELQEIKKDIVILKDREDKVEKILMWKERISDVVSPAQLEQMVEDTKDFREFKIRAVTIFLVIQFLMSFIMFYLKLHK